MGDGLPISVDEVLLTTPALACHAPTLDGRALGPPVIHALPAHAVAGLLDHLGRRKDWTVVEALCQALALLRCPSPDMLCRIEAQVAALLREWPAEEAPPTGALCALAAHSGPRFLALTWDALGEDRFLAQANHIVPALHFGVRVALTAGRGLDPSWGTFDLKNRMEDLLESATFPGATHDLLETAECLCCHIRRTGDRRPTGLAAVACRALLQHWRDPGVGQCARDLGFASVLRIFEYRHELFGLRFSDDAVSSRFSAALVPDVLRLHAHARTTATAPPILYRLLARACPLHQLFALAPVGDDFPRLLGAILHEASKELRPHLEALDQALDASLPPPVVPAGARAVLQHLRGLDARLPQEYGRAYPPWVISYGLHGSPTHSHLLYGLLFGWAAFTDLLRTAGWRFWPRPVSRAVAALALLTPDPPSIDRLLHTLSGWTATDRPIDTRSLVGDLQALVTALTICGRALAIDPGQHSATGWVCDLLAAVGVDSLHPATAATPADLRLHHAATCGLLQILDLRPSLARSSAATIRSYVQTSEASLRDMPLVRAWDSLQLLHRTYLAQL